MNRLVARFAREGVVVVAGWRGEVNVPGLTQVRPDLLVQASAGTLRPETHGIEFERRAVYSWDVGYTLRPYRRMAALRKARAVNSRPQGGPRQSTSRRRFQE